MLALVAAAASGSGEQPAEDLAAVAVQTLERLLAAGDHSRAIAGELLAVDALVTYACEAAADRWSSSARGPDALIDWCDSLAGRIAATARLAE